MADFLESRRYGDAFTHRYLLPMASAIWSASLDAIRSFPALTLIRFLDNHGLLSLSAQPTWRVVAGGSHTYIPRLTAPVSTGIHEETEIVSVRRSERDVTIAFRGRPWMRFDEWRASTCRHSGCGGRACRECAASRATASASVRPLRPRQPVRQIR